MKLIPQILACCLLALGCPLLSTALATPSIFQTVAHTKNYKPDEYANHITKYYQNVPQSHADDLEVRLRAASAYFLKKPYLLGPLGEGPNGEFDQDPLYRTDAFDCLTYVNTVLALAFSDDLSGFEKKLLTLRYANGKPSFLKRNHFTSVDWNKHNDHNGLIQDLTYQFVDDTGKPIARVAEAIINKPAWFGQLPKESIKLRNDVDELVLTQKLRALHQLKKEVQQEKAATLYVPLTELFDENAKPKASMFKQIPDTAIIQIVRPNWDVKSSIGTNVNISHLGFAIRTPKGLVFREASSSHHHVVDVDLASYLKQYLESKTIKGISIWRIG